MTVEQRWGVGGQEQEAEDSHSEQQAELGDRTRLALDFKTSKPTPNDTAPPAMPHLLNFPKQCH